MSESYNTREEAETKIKERNESVEPTWFCPLRNATCTKECVCFTKAYVIPTKRYEHGKSSATEMAPFTVHGLECGNMMFFRECQNG